MFCLIIFPYFSFFIFHSSLFTMFKPFLFIPYGMISVFSTIVYAQGVALHEISGIISEHGIAGGCAIIFGFLSIAGAVRWYKDLRAEIQQRDLIIAEREKQINELTAKNTKLTGELAKFKERSRSINHESDDE